MKLKLTDEQVAFRDEMRTFFTTEIPAEIRERTRHGLHVDKEDLVTTQRILNAHGLAVPQWPVEWGGRDWTPMQRHIWLDEMQLASVPEPLPLNTAMVGPVIARFGSQAQKQRFLPATANLDIAWCQGFSEPDAGSDLASLKTGRSATAATTSSTARRPGPRAPSTRTGSSASCAPTRPHLNRRPGSHSC